MIPLVVSSCVILYSVAWITNARARRQVHLGPAAQTATDLIRADFWVVGVEGALKGLLIRVTTLARNI